MARILTADDMAGLVTADPALLNVVITDVENYAISEIPGLDDVVLTTGVFPEQVVARVRSVLRQAVRRYIEAGTGAIVTQAAPGGYSQTVDATALRRGGLLYARELDTLRKILGVSKTSGDPRRAIMLGGVPGTHAPWCGTTWSAACDCPVDNPWRSW